VWTADALQNIVAAVIAKLQNCNEIARLQNLCIYIGAAFRCWKDAALRLLLGLELTVTNDIIYVEGRRQKTIGDKKSKSRRHFNDLEESQSDISL